VGIAVLFPGQGTQVPGMGEVWRASPAWEIVDRAESALGQPLAHLLLEADADALARTREAQLAVLLTSLMAWEAVRHALDEAPLAFAGHSLGQITALIASGVVSLEDGVRLAAERADCTQAAADARPGRMAALLGADVDRAEAASAGATTAGRTCWVANDNAPGQVVIGGTPKGVESAAARAKDLGVKRVIPLKVGAAFHTPLMAPAAAHLFDHLGDTSFAAPVAPVVTNTDAAPHRGADGWPERLSLHLVSPVRWRESLETLAALGASTFLEVGPGNVLSALVRRSLSGVATRNVATPSDIPLLLEVA
jgi:[acyl-carrier-protein] S-malonyltransferase